MHQNTRKFIKHGTSTGLVYSIINSCPLPKIPVCILNLSSYCMHCLTTSYSTLMLEGCPNSIPAVILSQYINGKSILFVTEKVLLSNIYIGKYKFQILDAMELFKREQYHTQHTFPLRFCWKFLYHYKNNVNYIETNLNNNDLNQVKYGN